ncbi:hypothetical protein OPU71_00035 [Niveibacterium sp. 24ML]|uniref:G8 domain-containing protein n=1 Tax=Niveibacterium sp. 24ML TaxID=2985512 RepID=UPI0022716540|nr:G8 domain-containing protein [Niveibacterium sp. 24ML]MCX9154506.1 hypothetical protein [Niveibacterium sp. 24ML]
MPPRALLPAFRAHAASIALLLTLAACGGGGGGDTGPSAPAPTPAPPVSEPGGDLLRWSDLKTWGGVRLPQAGEVVVIPAGMRVALDVDPPELGGLVIDGSLEAVARDTRLTAAYITVAGRLSIGSAAQPFQHRAEITLTGAPGASVLGVSSRGLILNGGTVEMVGEAPAVAWTQINEHAEAGSRALVLKEAVSWRAGDTISIAPTDYYGLASTERLTLADNSAGNRLQLGSALAQFHWGRLQYVTRKGMSLSPDPDFVPPATPFPTELDQRAVVANLSRSIVVQGADDAAWRTQGLGAHIMVLDSRSHLRLDGVEIRRAGQAGSMGRYPVHWHMLSYDEAGNVKADLRDNYIRNSSVWDSRNRCVVIHGTNGIEVKNNICHDITGHAFFLEDAVERRNLFERNLALKVRNPAPEQRLQTHEGPVFQGGSSGFWLTNPDNVVRHNWAADAEGNGFWLSFPHRPVGLSKHVKMMPDRVRHGVFEYNTAHSNQRPGVMLEWVPINDAGDVALNKYVPTSDEGDDRYAENRIRFELKRVASWKNLEGAYRNRVSAPDYTEWVTADNVGTYFAGAGDDGWITRNLVVGTSLNNRHPYPNPEDTPVAFASYHSTFNMTRNVIVNMPFVPGKASGVFRTDDYYITAVDKGTVRNGQNMLIDAYPGYRELSPQLRNPVPDREHWALAGALWDPHGYWGPAGNYTVFDIPFLTHGATCQPVEPAGQNGVTCSGEFYGVGDFLTDFDTNRFSFGAPIEVIRQSDQGAEIDRWRIADGSVSNKLGNMRHFAARPGGQYVLSFPGKPLPKRFEMSVSNAYRAGDSFVMAVAYGGRDTPLAYTVASVYNRANPYTPEAGSAQRRELTAASSLAQVKASAGDRYWIDRSTQRIWFKFKGGLAGYENLTPNSDDDLYRGYSVVIHGD